jgi:hypothetical protein
LINPITIPDPATLALAQTLQNRRRAWVLNYQREVWVD